MKLRHLLALILVLTNSTQLFAGEAFDLLQGSWKSDKVGTLRELKKMDHWTADRLKIIDGILGSLKVKYEGAKVFAEIKEKKITGNLKVLSEVKNVLVIEITDSEGNKDTSTYEVFKDHYWVVPKDTQHYKELFKRIE